MFPSPNPAMDIIGYSSTHSFAHSTPPSFQSVADKIQYKDGYRLLLERDKTDPSGRWYFQVEAQRPDSSTGVIGKGLGGKAYLSPHMTLSELIRLAFGLFRAYEEHEAREFFKYNGRAVFGPHINVEALWAVADDLEIRPPVDAT